MDIHQESEVDIHGYITLQVFKLWQYYAIFSPALTFTGKIIPHNMSCFSEKRKPDILNFVPTG